MLAKTTNPVNFLGQQKGHPPIGKVHNWVNVIPVTELFWADINKVNTSFPGVNACPHTYNHQVEA